MRQTFLFWLFLCCWLPAGCLSSTPLPGDVATVNGEGITLADLEGRRASLFPAVPDPLGQEPDGELQHQYVYALRELIQEKLIEQYLRKKNIPLPKTMLQQRIEELRGGYSQEEFEQWVTQEGITYGEWCKRLKRELLVEYFYTHVLREEVVIPSDEVWQYYSDHKSLFFMPEQWHFLQFSDIERQPLENAKKDFLRTKNATLMPQTTVTVRDIMMGKDRLPADIMNHIQHLAPFEFSQISKFDGRFRLFVLLEKIPARELEAAEIYKRVEPVLMEDKMREAYDAWLKKRLAKSSVRIHQALLDKTVGQVAGQHDDLPSSDE